MIDVVLYTN